MASSEAAEASGARPGAFAPPVGYRRSTLASADDDAELWVIRVPDEVDAAKLDGVTLPLDALQQGSTRDALASVAVEGAEYDVFLASSQRADERSSSSSQLIDMAGGARPDVFVNDDFFLQERGVGVATDLHGIVPLVPTSSNTLRVAPKRLHRRMYLARRAPKSTPDEPVHAVPHQAHVQPWDRLKGRLYVHNLRSVPAGALAAKPKSEKKKRKSSDASKLRKKT